MEIQPTNITEGLSLSTVLRRQEEDGLNELPTTRSRKLYSFVAELFTEPMVFLLTGCGTIYFILGDRQEALMLLSFLFIIIGITIYQERKAEKALEALRDLSSPRALVIREGKKERISGREVVRDDIVLINEGDRIPADGVLIQGSYVGVDESLLTGESMAVDKDVVQLPNLFAGTTVVRGQGIMQVTATGICTELGKIGKSIESTPRERTQLENKTQDLVKVLAWVAAAICVMVAVVYGLTRANWLGGILAGLTLAMAILPNELPAVLTIFLALGAWRISQRRVLTRKMPAVENLGAATVLCVDKTGTLTLNRMSVQRLFSNGKFLDLSQKVIQELPEDFHELLEFAILASRLDPFDPMEKAFIAAGTQYLQGTAYVHSDWSLKREYPLSPTLLSISHAWRSNREKGYIIGAKGAPEAIVDLCHLSMTKASEISARAEEMAKAGLRVLGVAKSRTLEKPLPSQQHDFDFEFVGLVGLADPIRPEVPQAVSECKRAGVRVLMITGDHSDTAKSIARQIGLLNADQVLTGAEIESLSPSQLSQTVANINVFSRMTPAQKLKLVNALKGRGEVVAMTGDGVNDAPALKSADIGIAMGGRGTDVARESAAIVLLDDDFASIVESIRMGRRVYSNLQSALVYLMAVHIPIAGMSILPVVLKLPLVLLPVHIAFLHLIIEPACSIVFEAEPAGPRTMHVPPHDPKEPLFNRSLLIRSAIQGCSILVALITIYMISLYRGQGEMDARALTFTTLILSNLTLILTSRAPHMSSTETNRTVRWILLGSILVLGFVLYNPTFRHLFRFSTLHGIDLVVCFFVGSLSAAWFEIFRRLKTP